MNSFLRSLLHIVFEPPSYKDFYNRFIFLYLQLVASSTYLCRKFWNAFRIDLKLSHYVFKYIFCRFHSIARWVVVTTKLCCCEMCQIGPHECDVNNISYVCVSLLPDLQLGAILRALSPIDRPRVSCLNKYRSEMNRNNSPTASIKKCRSLRSSHSKTASSNFTNEILTE